MRNIKTAFKGIDSYYKNYHTMFSFPIKGEMLEEIICRNLRDRGESFLWNSGSHATFTDIAISGTKVAVKSGKLQSGFISVSSSRTTSFPKVADKIKFINKSVNECHNIYLSAIKETNNSLSYKCYLIDSFEFNVGENFLPNLGGYGYKDETKRVNIVNNMSDQFWYYFKEEALEKYCLFSVDFTKKRSISGLDEIQERK